MQFDDLVVRFGEDVAFDKGAHVFHAGDEDRHFYVVKDGLLKAYYLSEDGKENIKSFLMTGDVIGSLAAVRGENGCSFNLVCLRPCNLVRISFDTAMEFARENSEASWLICEFLIAFGMKKERREHDLLCLTAEARYRKLRAERPELLSLVQQSDLALYLGVTPVGLSRIKKRVEG